MKKLFFLFTVVNSLSFTAQTEKLNQFNPDGKKHGKWILYLDAWGAKIDDSAKAEFKRFTWYDNGVHIQPMGTLINKECHILKDGAPVDLSGPALLMDGEYKCADIEGKTRFIHQFKNGEYIFYKEFYPTGELQSHFDYTRHAEGQPQSWLMTVYNKDGSVRHEEMIKKDKKGVWPKMKG